MSSQKLIVIIGATGAQGRAVIDALLAPVADGSPSPYAVRALTRDPKGSHALQLSARGVECVQGAFDDFDSVAAAFDGAYGAWVNTDGFTVGEMKEIYSGIRIFETAKQTPSLRHYVWSNLHHPFKDTGYNPNYKVGHMDGKARVGEWLQAQPSILSDDGLTWSKVTSGPYMELLQTVMFGPLNKRKDGTFVFASPVADGQVPMIALGDLGWWARWTFDHRAETSARNLEISTEKVGWKHLVETFTRVTGHPAVFKRQTIDEWWTNFDDRINNPAANERERGDGSVTIRENFSAFWRVLRDDIIKKDMAWIRSVHPTGYTLESWMREKKYEGQFESQLKNEQDGKAWGPNREKMALL
ncbi:NAD(P)-binding protein [Mycena sp. CBHHK59/15]|nr:NAD(P)-binding protein [Mycena sp. CBHHK59/15]